MHMFFIGQLADGPPTAESSIPRVDRRIEKLWYDCPAAGGVSVSYSTRRESSRCGQGGVSGAGTGVSWGEVDAGGIGAVDKVWQSCQVKSISSNSCSTERNARTLVAGLRTALHSGGNPYNFAGGFFRRQAEQSAGWNGDDLMEQLGKLWQFFLLKEPSESGGRETVGTSPGNPDVTVDGPTVSACVGVISILVRIV